MSPKRLLAGAVVAGVALMVVWAIASLAFSAAGSSGGGLPRLTLEFFEVAALFLIAMVVAVLVYRWSKRR